MRRAQRAVGQRRFLPGVVKINPREFVLVDALNHLLVGIIRIGGCAVCINRDERDALRPVF
ncbi:hypothetical protein D3C84_1216300 [compost metagenome]